jgi:oxygen-independent coproporphyrinogen-3 oxidase
VPPSAVLLQELLQTCGRSHSLPDVAAAIDAVKASGIHSWSLDLISGLPKLTLEAWQQSLDQAVAAGPHHISIYDLQVWCYLPLYNKQHPRRYVKFDGGKHQAARAHK